MIKTCSLWGYRFFMSNYIKFWLRNALYVTAVLFFSGTIIQTFLIRQGIDSGAVGIHTTVLNSVNVLTTMLFSGMADKRGNTVRAITRLLIPVGIIYLGYIPLCIFFTDFSVLTFWAVILLGTIQSFFIAFRTAFEYKLPYQIIDIEHYSSLIATDGIITGVFGIISSTVLSYMFGLFPYYTVMLYGFITAAICTLISAYINHTFKVIPAEINNTPTVLISGKKQQFGYLRDLLKMSVFTRFIPSNFLRGIAGGVFSMAAVIALKSNKVSIADTTYLVIALSVANVAGSIFFALISRRLNCRVLCLCGSVVMAALSFMTAGSGSLIIFIYFIICVGKIFVDCSVPTLLYKIIPYDIAGSYHAWRLILTTAGSALAATATGYLIIYIPAVYLLIFASLCQLCSGWTYFSSPILHNPNL